MAPPFTFAASIHPLGLNIRSLFSLAYDFKRNSFLFDHLGQKEADSRTWA